MNLRCCFTLAVWVVSALAQSADPGAANRIATIRGVVRDAADGQPIPEYVVTAILPGSSASQQPPSARTDAQGRFSISGMPPGQYTLSIGSGRTLPVASRTVTVAGDDVDSLDIRITAEGRVSGRVLDEFKEPVPNMTVFLISREYYRGAVQYVMRASTATSAAGVFQLAHVPSGRPFLLMAVTRKGLEQPLPARSDVPEDTSLRRKIVAPTFYPNAPRKEGAAAIILRSGEHRENVDIEVRKTPGFCIAGKLSSGMEHRPLSMELREPRAGAGNGFNYYTRAPQIAADSNGEFRVCDLAPGEYRLSSFDSAGSGAAQFALAEVAIVDRDVTGVVLTATTSVQIDGEATWGADQPKDIPETRVTLSLQPVSHVRFGGESLGAALSVPGKFTLPCLLVDDYALHASVSGSGLYIKDVEYAGHSILHLPFRPGSAMPGAGLKVFVGQDGGTVTTRVVDPDGKPVTNARIFILPKQAVSDAELADSLVSGEPDQFGQYTSPALRPGAYHVFATLKAIDFTPESIAAISRSRSRFEEITLAPNAARQMTIKPIEIE